MYRVVCALFLVFATLSTSTPHPTSAAPRNSRPVRRGSTARTGRDLTDTIILTGNCVQIGVSAKGTFGLGPYDGTAFPGPGIQYDNTCTGTFDPAKDYLIQYRGAADDDSNPATDAWDNMVVKSDFGHMFENIAWGPNNFHTNAALADKSGVAYNGSTWDHRVIQTAEASTGTISIENDIHFNDNSKFIEIDMTVTIGSGPSYPAFLWDVWMGRMFDPYVLVDGSDTFTRGNYAGYSTIRQNNIVFAEGDHSKYVIGLYTGAETDTNSSVSFRQYDPQHFYEGYQRGNGQNAIGISMHKGIVIPGSTLTFHYAILLNDTAYHAAANAVALGLAGGTPGVVPGCPGCVVRDVGSAVMTYTATSVPTETYTRTPSATITDTPTPTDTLTPTDTSVPTNTRTATETASATSARLPTNTRTVAAASATRTSTSAPVATDTSTPTNTTVVTPSATLTASRVVTASKTKSPTRTIKVKPSKTITLTRTASNTPTITQTRTETKTRTATRTKKIKPTNTKRAGTTASSYWWQAYIR